MASHSVLAHRRYNPIVADLKCVLNIEGVPQRFLKACFTEWTKVLIMVQVRVGEAWMLLCCGMALTGYFLYVVFGMLVVPAARTHWRMCMYKIYAH